MVVAVEPLHVAYMAVPKAACSSVKAALAIADPGVDRDLTDFSADLMAAHNVYPTMRFRRHRWVEYQGWFRFTVVRDPLKRLLSVYTDLVASRNQLKNSRKFQNGRAPVTDEPDPDFFFQNLDTYTEFASVMHHHTLPTQIFTGPKLKRYTKVYTTAQMADLARDLTQATGRDITIPRLNKSKAKLRYDDLAPQTRDAIRTRLEPEYAHLSDYFDRPW